MVNIFINKCNYEIKYLIHLLRAIWYVVNISFYRNCWNRQYISINLKKKHVPQKTTYQRKVASFPSSQYHLTKEANFLQKELTHFEPPLKTSLWTNTNFVLRNISVNLQCLIDVSGVLSSLTSSLLRWCSIYILILGLCKQFLWKNSLFHYDIIFLKWTNVLKANNWY